MALSRDIGESNKKASSATEREGINTSQAIKEMTFLLLDININLVSASVRLEPKD